MQRGDYQHLKSGVAPHRLDLRDLWTHRQLIYVFVWRDIKIRTNKPRLAWSDVLQPPAMMIVFGLFWGRLARLSSDGVLYRLFTMSAILPTQLFSRVNESTKSLVSDQRLPYGRRTPSPVGFSKLAHGSALIWQRLGFQSCCKNALV